MKYQFNWGEVIILLGLVVTPVALVWKALNFGEPHGIYENVRLVILLIFTGCGGIGIGMLLANAYVNMFDELKLSKFHEHSKSKVKYKRN